MGYRTQRRFKQQQRAYADYMCEQDRKLDEYFGEYEQPTYDERELSHSDEHYSRIEAEVNYFSRSR